MISKTGIRARYEESDQMGFIHHSNHIVWMELARMNLLRECGIDYRELENSGYILPVVKVVTRYVAPAYFDDEIQVRAAFTKVSRAKIRIDYLILRNADELLCYGYTEHGFLKKDTNTPVDIPDDIRGKIVVSQTANRWKTRTLV